MILKQGNILNDFENGDIICFTSNGIVKKDGSLVMGAGVAKTFRDTFKGIDKVMGEQVTKHGNNVLFAGTGCINNRKAFIFSFPTKINYKDNSSYTLIEKSCKQLLEIYNRGKKSGKFTGKVHITPPGIVNGKLQWSIVYKILNKYFGDNDDFIINYITPLEEKSHLTLINKKNNKFINSSVKCKCGCSTHYIEYYPKLNRMFARCSSCNKAVYEVINSAMWDFLIEGIWI